MKTVVRNALGSSVGEFEVACVGVNNDVIEVRLAEGTSDQAINAISTNTDLPVIMCRRKAQMVTYNHLSRGTVQSGATRVDEHFFQPDIAEYPAWRHNLLGTGQVVGVADTGIDMSHCFFRQDGEDPREFFSWSSNPPAPPLRNFNFRKVVQYVAYADDNDFDGHGTHVCGSIAGEVETSKFPFSPNSVFAGMAPRSKLAFFDSRFPS